MIGFDVGSSLRFLFKASITRNIQFYDILRWCALKKLLQRYLKTLYSMKFGRIFFMIIITNYSKPKSTNP